MGSPLLAKTSQTDASIIREVSDADAAPVHTGSLFYGWVIVAVGFIVQGICLGTHYISSLLVQPLRLAFQTTNASVLFFSSSAVMFGVAVLSPVWGWLLPKITLRKAIAIAIAAVSAGYTGLGFATQLWHIGVLYAVFFSTGMALSTLATNTLINNWFILRRGRALGIAAAGISTVGFIVPPLAGWSLQHWGLQITCFVMGVGSALLILPVAGLTIDLPEQKHLHPDGISQRSVVTHRDDDGPTWSLRDLFRDRRFWLIVVLGSGCYCVVSVLVINLVSIATANHFSGEQAALLVSCVAACGVIGKLSFGVLYETMRRRLMVRIPVLCLFVACLLLITSHGYVSMLIASAATGLAMGANALIPPMLAGQFFGRHTFTLSLGVINPFLTMSLVLILPVFGGLFDQFGSYQPGLLLLIVLLAIVVIVTPLLPERASSTH